jgi:uncharacterized protein (UPF0371 family)
LKQIPSIFLVCFLGFFIAMIIAVYFTLDTKQNEQTYALNETVSTYLTANMDLGAARVGEGVFIEKTAFESSVQSELKKKYDTALFDFKYLEYSNGALKAIKVFMTIGEKQYSSTLKVNEI